MEDSKIDSVDDIYDIIDEEKVKEEPPKIIKLIDSLNIDYSFDDLMDENFGKEK